MQNTDRNRGLTQDRLYRLLAYDLVSGQFTWRINIGRARAGSQAGKKHEKGYVLIGIGGDHYLAHRLAWFYVYGEWPADELDHKNLRKDDNRIENLRQATKTQNMQNTTRMSRNSSGFKGVCWDTKTNKWVARICHNKQRVILGYFHSPVAAADAYADAANKLFGEFARAA